MRTIVTENFKSVLSEMTENERCAFERYTRNSPYTAGHEGIWAVADINEACQAVLHIGECVTLHLTGILADELMRFSGLIYALRWLNTEGMVWADKQLAMLKQLQLECELASTAS